MPASTRPKLTYSYFPNQGEPFNEVRTIGLKGENPDAFIVSSREYGETREYLKKHSSFQEIIRATRDRFDEIFELLEKEGINKHDQGHQVRVALNSAIAMRKMDFSNRETVVATIAGLLHDYGYNRYDKEYSNKSEEGYLGGKKGKFKKHAIQGADEVVRKIKAMKRIIANTESNPNASQEEKEKIAYWKKLLSYTDEKGTQSLLNEQDLELIHETILHHNDYGKKSEDYNPYNVSHSALMIQVFDKVDHCKQRVYDEHLKPEAFMMGHPEFDSKYYHRSVPACIQRNEFEINPEKGVMTCRYYIDTGDFEAMMQKQLPDFEYTTEAYTKDFIAAYKKNSKVAAEAIAVLTGRKTHKRTLHVELIFANGDEEHLTFKGPKRKAPKKAREQVQESPESMPLEEAIAPEGFESSE
jgi:HD superfamily phosphodiesterase